MHYCIQSSRWPCEVDSISLPIFGFGSWGKEMLHQRNKDLNLCSVILEWVFTQCLQCAWKLVMYFGDTERRKNMVLASQSSIWSCRQNQRQWMWIIIVIVITNIYWVPDTVLSTYSSENIHSVDTTTISILQIKKLKQRGYAIWFW